MRLNICCGRHVLDGWINVDVQASPKARRPPEILSTCTKVPLPDGCAGEIMVIHGFEHLYLWEVPQALAEWHRLLEPGGLLALEMPDIKKCALNLLKWIDTQDAKHLDSQAMHGLYGDPTTMDPYMGHKWGWAPKTLRPVLSHAGFGKLKTAETQWHPIGRRHRDFRIEARKLV